jgi:hypothetical protein
MTGIEVKGRDPKSTGDIVGIYRVPNQDIRVLERLAARTGFKGKCLKRSIKGGDLSFLMQIVMVTRNVLAELRHL